jgi:dynein heavy chain 1, cytosolic
LIAQVMLFTQGFNHAEHLASKAIPFFEICEQQLSSHGHYDFGLRALKNVLVSAGILQRSYLQKNLPSAHKEGKDVQAESDILVQSIRGTLFPKLVQEDEELAERYCRLT